MPTKKEHWMVCEYILVFLPNILVKLFKSLNDILYKIKKMCNYSIYYTDKCNIERSNYFDIVRKSSEGN